jgi:hypothetical protein
MTNRANGRCYPLPVGLLAVALSGGACATSPIGQAVDHAAVSSEGPVERPADPIAVTGGTSVADAPELPLGAAAHGSTENSEDLWPMSCEPPTGHGDFGRADRFFRIELRRAGRLVLRLDSARGGGIELMTAGTPMNYVACAFAPEEPDASATIDLDVDSGSYVLIVSDEGLGGSKFLLTTSFEPTGATP